jgi:hypothetical protein
VLNRIGILRNLLLKKLTVPTHGDDLHHVILRYGLVESMSECLKMIERHDGCDLLMPLWMS